MAAPRAFTLSIPEDRLTELKWKLEHATFPQEMDEPDWQTGAPRSEVQRLVEYWKNSFDWRKVERNINKLPNYETRIDIGGFEPVDVHFVHQESATKEAIPLLFVHGWPGSFIEATRILPLLQDSEKNGGPAFHVVVPSLPNYGFSSGAKKTGFGLKQYAETCHKLMLSLGYEQYVSQGGDWGASITRTIARLYPQSLRAIHLNFITPDVPTHKSPIVLISFLFRYLFGLLPPIEKEGLARTQEWAKSGTGYFHIQTTKPQTMGYLLADSPAGLLGWIYEKLHSWTDGYKWTYEEICTWISIYWFSRAGPAANVRTYYEAWRGDILVAEIGYLPDVKIGLSYFPKEVLRFPKSWAPSMGEIVYAKEHKRGGHFAAWECPELLVGDIKLMFGKGGGAYGVVDGKTGYA